MERVGLTIPKGDVNGILNGLAHILRLGKGVSGAKEIREQKRMLRPIEMLPRNNCC